MEGDLGAGYMGRGAIGDGAGDRNGVERADATFNVNGVALRDMDGSRSIFPSRCSACKTRTQRCLQMSSDRRGPDSSSVPSCGGDLIVPWGPAVEPEATK